MNSDKTYMIGYLSSNYFENYTIPETVKEMGYYCFHTTPNLKELTINKDCEKIYSRSFFRLADLEQFIVEEGSETFKAINGSLYSLDGKTLHHYAVGKKDKHVVIADSVTSIEHRCFFGTVVRNIGSYI